MADVLQQCLSECIDDMALWTMSNRLQVNRAKSQLLWCASARRQQQIPTIPVCVGSTSVFPVATVRDLGVYLDADVSMAVHVTATVKACFAALRQIRSVRRSTVTWSFTNNTTNNNNNNDLYSAFRSEDTEALDAAQED